MQGEPLEKSEGHVCKTILRPGTGDIPPPGSRCFVHYDGKFTNGEVFDSSRLRRGCFTFVLGTGAVIPAWELAVATMRVGEIARITTRSSYAYGSLGHPPRIPVSATLVFDIELVNFHDIASVVEQGEKPPLILLVSRCRNMKREGGEHYARKAYRKASKAYNRGLALLDGKTAGGSSTALAPPEVEAEADQLRRLLQLNLAACYLQLGEWERGLRAVRWVLAREPDNPKAVLRYARLLMGAGQLTEAVEPLRRAKQLVPAQSPALRAAFAEYTRRRQSLQKQNRTL